MENKAKPRICEVLGVEVGELFTADYPYKDLGKMEVRDDGKVVFGTGKVRSNALCYMINHPGCIHKIRRWTPEEVELATAIKVIWPEARKLRCFSISVGVYDQDDLLQWVTPERFPTLKEGETVKLADIIGGENNA